MRPIPVIINREGGTAAAGGDALTGAIEDEFRDAGLIAHVQLLKAEDIVAAVEAQAHASLVVVGGGDGTLAAAAGALLGGHAALGILPLGTRNHLALQLGIPRDIPGAVRLLAEGHQRPIDVAQVNGVTFVNNASIGFYPLLVRSREEEQRRHGLPKWLANLKAARTALRRLRHHRLHVRIDGVDRTILTPLLFVGNNVYSLEGGHIGERHALDEGKLSLFAVASGSRLSALWFALRAVAGRSDLEQDFAAAEICERLTVSTHAPAIHIALDGEVRQLATPLRFQIRPQCLRVVAPAQI
ncbi:MAG TPA: diacylglycerol kinase family protein [Sphingomonas sp.]|nr:diacylglycerol kinase family protein [Sphingomonas sp.]